MQISGTITHVDRHTNSNGKSWATVTVQAGEVTELVTFFPSRYRQHAHLLRENKPVTVEYREDVNRARRTLFAHAAQAGAR